MKPDGSLSAQEPGRCGTLFGLPPEAARAPILVLPVPWGVTTSYGRGAADGPRAVIAASNQLDFYRETQTDDDASLPECAPYPEWIRELDRRISPDAERLIRMLDGREASTPEEIERCRRDIDEACARVIGQTLENALACIAGHRLAAILGGDHSCAIAGIRAVAATSPRAFGVLQFDAHADLRKAYMGLTYSHASVMRLALAEPSVMRLVQVGIRDRCSDEVAFALAQGDRVAVFSERRIQQRLYAGDSWASIAKAIVRELPRDFYVSFDVDALRPSLCPGTGTPVPDGLDFEQALYIVELAVESGRRLVGFDVCETGGAATSAEWDGNVGARLLWRLCVAAMGSER